MDENNLQMNQPFDRFQQYQVIVEVLRLLRQDLKQKELRLLHVGGIGNSDDDQQKLTVSTFFPEDEVVLLDPYCESPSSRDIQARVTLPFKPGVFDVSYVLDGWVTYGAGERKELLEELIRVSRHLVIIGAPFNTTKVNLSEQLLYEYSRGTFGKELQEIRRHIHVGLPYLEELLRQLRAAQLQFKEFPSSNVYLWISMHLLRHYFGSLPNGKILQPMLDRFYNENFYPGDHQNPSYRRFIIIGTPQNARTVKAAYDLFTSRRQRAGLPENPHDTFVMLLTLLTLWTRNEQLNQNRSREDELKKELDTVRNTIIQLEKKNASVNQSIIDRDAQISSLKYTLKEKEREVTSYISAVAKREEEVVQLNRNLTRLKGEVEQGESDERLRLESIRSLEEAIAQLKNDYKSLESFIIEKEKELTDLIKNPLTKLVIGNDIEKIARSIRNKIPRRTT